ncbi:hypothetical protein GCM10010392_42960 [Streptomyces clavifer]|nr:hypothetical protein GCM10010392_42960 [Streptomyces clavifer]
MEEAGEAGEVGEVERAGERVPAAVEGVAVARAGARAGPAAGVEAARARR